MKIEKFGQLRRIRPNKTWIVLGVALVIGCLAAFAAYSYLRNQINRIENRNKSHSVVVLVAKIDVAKGTKLSQENVAVRSVPQEYAHSVALTPEDFDRVNGQALAYPVKAGEMILWGLMETQRAPTFSARIDPGHRAMTVAVDEINSISGMLEPGDSIDLMITLEKDGKKRTFPLMQNVLVMATGQRSVDDPATGEQRSYSTVTIDTTPQQAQNLIVARDAGKMTALLRNPTDKQVVGAAGMDLSALMGSPKPAGTGRRGIPVLYGGGQAIDPAALRLPQYPARAANAPGAANAPVAPVAPVAPGAGTPAAPSAGGDRTPITATIR